MRAVAMNKLIYALVVIALAGSLQAQNYYYGKILTARIYFFDDDRGYFGFYQGQSDHSSGNIYIAKDLPTGWMIQTFVHEMCHYRQDMAKKQLDDAECYAMANRGII